MQYYNSVFPNMFMESSKESTNIIDFVVINDVEYLFEEYNSFYELINDIRDNNRFVAPNTEDYVRRTYESYKTYNESIQKYSYC